MTFFPIEIFSIFFLKFLNMSSVDSKITLILLEKIAKFELSHQKKVLDECSLTLEFLL